MKIFKKSSGLKKMGSDVEQFNIMLPSYLGRYLLIGAIFTAILMAGGPSLVGMGVFLAISGVVLVVFPTTRFVSWGIWVLAALLVVASSLSLSPDKCLGIAGGWKYLNVHLWKYLFEGIPGIPLPTSISPDPMVSFYWGLLLVATVLIGLHGLGSPVSPHKLQNIALFLCLLSSLYAALAAFAWKTGWQNPLFYKDPSIQPAFGFFPNRNHTAGFLITGAIISLGLILRGGRGARIMPAVLACGSLVLMCSSLLFYSISRGGLIFLIAGVLIWVIGLGRYRSRRFLVNFVALSLILLFFFLGSQSAILERIGIKLVAPVPGSMVAASGSNKSVKFSDPRLGIAMDTLDIIGDFPVTGTGFGTFSIVYPLYADKSLRGESWALHAESDWLTLCSEAGIPTLFLVFALIVLLIRRIPEMIEHSGREWPVRWALIAAFFAELLHGFVDVPLHKPELGWWVLILGCIGFSTGAGELEPRVKSLRIQRIILATGGVGIALLGFLLIWSQWLNGPSMFSKAPKAQRDEVLGLYLESMKKNDPDAAEADSRGALESHAKALDACRKALLTHPLDTNLYYQLALLYLYPGKDVASAMACFNVQRRLTPNDAWMVFEQGKVLRPFDQELAAASWKEALRRQLYLDSLPTCPYPRQTELYERMISEAIGYPYIYQRLYALVADANPKLRMMWFAQRDCQAVNIAQALNDQAFMSRISPKEQGQVFELWLGHGADRAEILDFLNKHPEYSRVAIVAHTSIMASSGQAKEACELVTQTFGIPMTEATAVPVMKAADNDVPDNSLEAARYYMKRGNNVAARRLLSESLRWDGEKRGEAYRLYAMIEMRDGNWNDALDFLIKYLRSTGQI
jgi:tetratricopeptide (TPR) repeat protein